MCPQTEPFFILFPRAFRALKGHHEQYRWLLFILHLTQDREEKVHFPHTVQALAYYAECTVPVTALFSCGC